jgi:hypothetical protein
MSFNETTQCARVITASKNPRSSCILKEDNQAIMGDKGRELQAFLKSAFVMTFSAVPILRGADILL